MGLKQAGLLGPLQFTSLPTSRAWPVLIAGRAGGTLNWMWLVRESVSPTLALFCGWSLLAACATLVLTGDNATILLL